jgi:hypothetical protein
MQHDFRATGTVVWATAWVKGSKGSNAVEMEAARLLNISR